MNAVLYLRFSTGEQRHGDSERRQISLAKKWCKERKHTLTKIYADRGISGGKGSHERKGLASLLDDLGKPNRPDFVLVEDVDRLSRQRPLEASKLMERILESGVTLISVEDGQEITKDNFQDTEVWIVYQLKTALANAEREKKTVRIRQAWGEKRQKVGDEIYTRRGPSWLKFTGGKKDGKFVPIPRNVDLVKELFRMASEGFGVVSMIRLLNERKEKSFMPNRDWNKATIYKVLTSTYFT